MTYLLPILLLIGVILLVSAIRTILSDHDYIVRGYDEDLWPVDRRKH